MGVGFGSQGRLLMKEIARRLCFITRFSKTREQILRFWTNNFNVIVILRIDLMRGFYYEQAVHFVCMVSYVYFCGFSLYNGQFGLL